MRVNELAKELGKTSKDVLDVLQKNHQDVTSHSSNVSDAQVSMVKKALGGSEQKAEGAAPKKKLAAVYRPQNSQQRPAQPKQAARPQAQSTAAQAQQAAAPQASKPAEGQQARPAQTAENRDNNRQGGFNGNRDNNRQGGFNGNRDNNRQGGFNGNRDNNRQGGFNGNRDNNRQGGFNGNRDNNRQGGFNGNRDNNRQGGFNGNRDNNRQGGFGGNRDNNRQGGFGGNRDNNRQGGFGGNREGGFNRDNNRQGGGFGGNRDNRQGGGFGGNRDNRQGGGFGGNRDNRQGGFGGNRQGGAGRPGQRDGGSKNYDTPIQTKPTNNRQQTNNAHKKDKYDKTRMMEDGPRNKNGKVSKHPFIMPQKPVEEKVEETVKVITIPDVLTIKELADKMKLQPSAIVKKLFLQGKIVTLNSEIDFEQAEEIAVEYDVLCEKEEKVDVIAELLKEDEENEEDMVSRPPVVCVMGHVDHGKTSLLDAIRQTNVTSREAGGITQHIGAYTVDVRGQQITFLDTPGHEAFTAMRMRGAQSTDIAILVVAADDGVMPQTVEAINHAKAAGVDIIVAINKIDKPSANVDRVKQELAEYELIPEDWGGNTVFVPVSAHTKEGIPELLEMILLTAEVKELKANPNRRARGLVIEAELDKGKGPVATILVQKGTLRVGDNVTAGPCYGKVRAMMDDKGRRVKEAGPSMPVEILGLNDVPGAGDVLMATENEKEARSYAETFISESKNKLLADTKAKISLDDLFSQIKAGNVKELPIIVKADVQGSVEAVKQSLVKLSNEEVVVKVIHGGVGAINESDVSLASASNAIIIGFNVRPDATAKSIADREKVDLRLYRVIYQAIEDVEAAMKGMLDPVYEEQVIGHAVVRQTFKASGVGTIAGAYVMDGKFQRGCSCRITRDGEQIFDGALASLKRFKDDVKEVATGYECGLVFEKFNDIKEDDMVEAYMMVEVPR
ncbi:translation initiation factor IF-2 [Clostridium sp. AM42-4]|uniref:translation initiation factor IF-2 n=2 Tax=unclassified Clostridium TaxID=2614128 RepID=UPI000E487AB6|nr:translation initiation factor IF-2 [Clostridium sp. AM42-4]RHS85108.1 translation initiation factor IF-2 [Clostridium sp. AM42-4]